MGYPSDRRLKRATAAREQDLLQRQQPLGVGADADVDFAWLIHVVDDPQGAQALEHVGKGAPDAPAAVLPRDVERIAGGVG